MAFKSDRNGYLEMLSSRYQHTQSFEVSVAVQEYFMAAIAKDRPDERYFEDANSFIPHRWTKKKELVKDERVFKPFSQGSFFLPHSSTVSSCQTDCFGCRSLQLRCTGASTYGNPGSLSLSGQRL